MVNDFDEKTFRLECLKLAQDAENDLAVSCAQMVTERAQKYADFVSGVSGMCGPLLLSGPAEQTVTEVYDAEEDAPRELDKWLLKVLPGQFTFSDALFYLKNDAQVARAGWNGKDMWLKLQVPNEDSKMSLPYIYMRTAQGDLVPWLASQTDLLAEDWFLV